MKTITKIFKPCDKLFLNHLKNHNYGVLILNSPTKLADKSLWNVWNHAKIRGLVDGGSESWMSWINNSTEERCEILQPHLVTGDFDSITKDTLENFKQNKSVEVIHTPDQDATDFTKALGELNNYRIRNCMEIESIYVLTEAIEGRTDQIMGNINTLFYAQHMIPDVTVFLLSADSISWLLMEGIYSISIPQILRDKNEWCSLIPVGSPAVVTTSGLKWNLNKTKSVFGELVSTSNTYDGSPDVTVETDSSILWSMSTSGLKCQCSIKVE